jgi:hypothetical protein
MTDKKTPEDLAEIFVFEHAHDQFGLSKQECYVAGYNAASQETSLLREENEKLRSALHGLVQYWEWSIGDPHFNEYINAKKALNPKQ